MSKIIFSTSTRDLKGKGVRRLRAQEIIPGNVYVAGGESVSLQFPQKEFAKLYKEAGDTSLVYLKIGDAQESRPTLIDEVQVDPVSGDVLHVSFKQVDLKEKIEAEVPIKLIGEFDVKEAVLVQVKNNIVVEALPNDFPEKFEVNIEELSAVGQSITLADLNFDKSKVSLVEVENDEDWEKPVVLVQAQREEEVEEVVEEVEGEDSEDEKTDDQDGEETKEDEPQDNAAAEKKEAKKEA